MSAQANLTLNTKVYAPRGNIGGVSKWTLAGDTSFNGASSSITESVREPQKSGVSRIKFKLDLPKAAGTNSACACEGDLIATGLCNIEVVVPSSFSASERDDFRLRIQGLVASQIFTDAVKDLIGTW